MSAFVLQIQDLDESGKDWTFAIGKDWLASALSDTELGPGSDDGRLDVHAQQNGNDVLVQGHITAELSAKCARCLEDVALPIDLAVATLYSPEHTRVAGVEEIDVSTGCYGSQFDDVKAMGELFPADVPFYDLIRIQDAHYGSLIRAAYGEPFYTRETLGVADVVQLAVSSF